MGLSAVHTLVEFVQQQEPHRDPAPSRELVLYDIPLQLMEPFPAARALGEIIHRHQHRPDTLSNSLVWYGREVMLFVREEQPSREVLISNLIGLRQILSLGSNMPNDPWMIGDLVGERQALDLYCKVVSKLSGVNVSLGTTGSPHEFAREVIAWIRQMEGSSQELPPVNRPRAELVPAYPVVINELGVPVLDEFPVEPQEPITSWNIEVNEDSITTDVARQIYNEFAVLINEQMETRREEIEREIEISRKIEFIEHLQEQNEISARELAENRVRDQQALIQHREDTERHTHNIMTSFSQLRTDYQSSETRLENKATGLEVALKDEKTKLADAIARINAQQVRISCLEGNNCRLWGEVRRLENEVNDSGSSCTIS